MKNERLTDEIKEIGTDKILAYRLKSGVMQLSVIQKLGEYESAEEQGLILRLKLKVGDTFWELNDNHQEPCIYPRIAHSLSHVLYCMDRLGKVTFLTEEEAEQALRKMGERA